MSSDDNGKILLDGFYVFKGDSIKIRLALFENSVILYELRNGKQWTKKKVWELQDHKFMRRQREDTIKATISYFKLLSSKHIRIK